MQLSLLKFIIEIVLTFAARKVESKKTGLRRHDKKLINKKLYLSSFNDP